MVSALNVPPPSRLPSATTPCPSRNRSGTPAKNVTGSSLLPSVTSKRTRRSLPRTMLPSFTRPPSRMRVPGPMCFSAMSLGELKNTIASRNALSISATATASTPSPAPIRIRRRCLRVIYIRLGCMMLTSAFQPEAFDEFVDPLDIVGMIRQRVPRVGGGILGLAAVAEYRIGAHQAQPAFDVAALGVQAIGQAADHAADHFDALLVAHARRGRHVRITRT